MKLEHNTVPGILHSPHKISPNFTDITKTHHIYLGKIMTRNTPKYKTRIKMQVSKNIQSTNGLTQTKNKRKTNTERVLQLLLVIIV